MVIMIILYNLRVLICIEIKRVITALLKSCTKEDDDILMNRLAKLLYLIKTP